MKLTNCKNKAIPKDILEKFVIDNIVKEMSKPKHMDYIVSRILEIQEEQCKIQPEISALLREQKEIKSTLANILHLQF